MSKADSNVPTLRPKSEPGPLQSLALSVTEAGVVGNILVSDLTYHVRRSLPHERSSSSNTAIRRSIPVV